MYGIDISSWQQGIDILSSPCDFVIMKATEGIGMVDNQFYNYVRQVENAGKYLGVYHFSRPDFNGTVSGMVNEAQFFIKTVKSTSIYDKCIFILDWETEPIARPDLIDVWLTTVEKETGVKPFIYGSSSKLKSSTFTKFIYEDGYPVWMAAWPTNSPIQNCRPYPAGTYPTSKLPWKIWQFSANGRGFGIYGAIDCDYTDMTPDEWKKHTIAGKILNPQPVKEPICPEMQWAIDNGIITGRADRKYYPYDYMTREEVMKVLYRYDEYLQKQLGYDK